MTRCGDGSRRAEPRAKVAAAFVLTVRGRLLVYMGMVLLNFNSWAVSVKLDAPLPTDR